MKEIERKYLIKLPPDDYFKWEKENIWQGYLAVTEDSKEIRIRKKGNKYYQTVKSGKGLTRLEIEIEISVKQFNTLWPATLGKRIEKTRYTKKYKNHMIELDIFEAAHQGLIIAEVEFNSEEESEQFKPLEWFGQEITTDERYMNRNLAQ